MIIATPRWPRIRENWSDSWHVLVFYNWNNTNDTNSVTTQQVNQLSRRHHHHHWRSTCLNPQHINKDGTCHFDMAKIFVHLKSSLTRLGSTSCFRSKYIFTGHAFSKITYFDVLDWRTARAFVFVFMLPMLLGSSVIDHLLVYTARASLLTFIQLVTKRGPALVMFSHKAYLLLKSFYSLTPWQLEGFYCAAWLNWQTNFHIKNNAAQNTCLEPNDTESWMQSSAHGSRSRVNCAQIFGKGILIDVSTKRLKR